MRRTNNFFFSLKIEGNALLYSLFVLLIVSLICSSLILYAYLNNRSLHSLYHKEDVIGYVNSAMNLLLDDSFIEPESKIEEYSLFSLEGDEVYLEKKAWGLYKILIAKKEWKNFNYERVAMAGDLIPSKDKIALYLVDMKKPLSMSGKAILKGKSFLPEAGIKTSIIEGKRFTGEMPFPGEILVSKQSLPFNPALFEALSFDYLLSKYLNPKRNNINPKISKKETGNSFTGTPKVFYSKAPLNIGKTKIEGQVVYISESAINVSKAAKVKDAIFVAPKIEISKGFEGCGQFFARDTLAVFEDVELFYPSALCVVNKQEGKRPFVFIDEDTRVNGLIANYYEKATDKDIPLIRVMEGAEITGQLFVNGNLEFKGTVKGSVLCNKFFLKTPVSIYENHLYDASIDLSALPKDYVGIDFSKENQLNKIIKWLN